MNIIVNGESKTIQAHTIKEVIDHYGLTGKPIVVEVDGAVLTSDHWEHTTLRDGMKIELVHFVGGG
ncbi:sulfur carrier protein ThiS [Paenibacillaceae bacterium]|nr:sulfur carrier protein ThiS [Paenibacillaceae bacterium]